MFVIVCVFLCQYEHIVLFLVDCMWFDMYYASCLQILCIIMDANPHLINTAAADTRNANLCRRHHARRRLSAQNW